MSEPPTMSESASSAFMRGLVGNLTASGIVIYGILILSYQRFYNPLGISPSELGLGFSQVLAQDAGLVGLGALTALVAFMVLLRRFTGLTMSARSESADWAKRMRRHDQIRFWGLASFASASVALIVVLQLLAAIRVADLIRGRTVRPVTLLGATVLNISAYPAQLTPVPNSVKGDCVLYLGGANGVTVLFDATRHKVLRVPASGLSVAVDPAATGC